MPGLRVVRWLYYAFIVTRPVPLCMLCQSALVKLGSVIRRLNLQIGRSQNDLYYGHSYIAHERLDPPLSGQYYIYSRECASAICCFGSPLIKVQQ